MPRLFTSVRYFYLAVALFWAGLPAAQTATVPNASLMGAVKSADGKAMEGVAVSARAQDKTYTISVYTDRNGQYYFQGLSDGQYRIWAQAVGFEIGRSEQPIASGKKLQQNFTLKPVQDFSKQLSGTEWLQSLPHSTPEDARMQRIISYNCTTCHNPAFPLNKRFDSAGWNVILDTMIHKAGGPNSPNGKYIASYKQDLVAYLSRARGPESFPGTFTPLPRATGDATKIVVTEYDVPLAPHPDYIMDHNGTVWSEGMPSMYEGQAMHDAVVGKDGNVYFSDPDTPERTLGKLDPRTGRVTSYKLDDKNGFAVSTHGAVVDQKGNVWLTNGTEGTFLEFDPTTESFKRWPKPGLTADRKPGGPARVGGSIAVDSKGNIWGTASSGAVRMNPETGEYTDFKSVTPGGSPYGIAVDSDDNAWITQLGSDRFMIVDGHTDEVSELVLPPVKEWKMDPRDVEIGQLDGNSANSAPLDHKGPRRMAADPASPVVWAGEYWAGNLVKIDTRTHKFTEYPMPSSMFHHPYAVVVDKNHMVWVSLLTSDRIAKFDPNTEKFTEYPMPSLGTQARFIAVDNTTGIPTVWLPEHALNKIAKVEFRTNPASQLNAKGK